MRFLPANQITKANYQVPIIIIDSLYLRRQGHPNKIIKLLTAHISKSSQSKLSAGLPPTCVIKVASSQNRQASTPLAPSRWSSQIISSSPHISKVAQAKIIKPHPYLQGHSSQNRQKPLRLRHQGRQVKIISTSSILAPQGRPKLSKTPHTPISPRSHKSKLSSSSACAVKSLKRNHRSLTPISQRSSKSKLSRLTSPLAPSVHQTKIISTSSITCAIKVAQAKTIKTSRAVKVTKAKIMKPHAICR